MCNLHSETALQLLASKGSGKVIRVFERVIKAGNWTPNMSAVTWNKDNIVIQTQVQKQDNSTVNHHFIIVEEQIYGFEKCLEFMINGNSWLASLISK
jgi:hypothetical protein